MRKEYKKYTILTLILQAVGELGSPSFRGFGRKCGDYLSPRQGSPAKDCVLRYLLLPVPRTGCKQGSPAFPRAELPYRERATGRYRQYPKAGPDRPGRVSRNHRQSLYL